MVAWRAHIGSMANRATTPESLEKRSGRQATKMVRSTQEGKLSAQKSAAGSALSHAEQKVSINGKAVHGAWFSSTAPNADLVLNIDDTLFVVAAKHLTHAEPSQSKIVKAGRSIALRGPLAKGLALLKGRERVNALLSEAGGTFDQEQVQTMLYGISRQAIDKRVREGSLLAVPGPNGARRYPVCQFQSDGSLVKGLKDVHAALPVRGPWSAFLFLMQPHSDLGGQKPLDLLRHGKIGEVVEAAKRLGVQGA